ncbi:MAG: site-specific DNA-methyltransferase, partial [Bacteroidetes bacterium]|nr:site-specific DNA-methyltransferase [Bacteroidota bacterium]
MELNKIYQGDCIEVMKGMEANSVDTVITDPPYGIGFMGKEWDTFNPELEKKTTEEW